MRFCVESDHFTLYRCNFAEDGLLLLVFQLRRLSLVLSELLSDGLRFACHQYGGFGTARDNPEAVRMALRSPVDLLTDLAICDGYILLVVFAEAEEAADGFDEVDGFGDDPINGFVDGLADHLNDFLDFFGDATDAEKSR